jgi:ATP-binding protein involved in chromosome partitioning
MATLKDEIWQALKGVAYPGHNRDIVSFGLVQRVAECDGLATVTLNQEQVPSGVWPEIESRIRSALAAVPGLETVQVQAGKPLEVRPKLARKKASPALRPDGVEYVLAVGSGKGGVGKSTVAANLATALARQGLRVGLMDADAYGPNLPRMMGASQLPPVKRGKIQPAESHGVRLVSLGLIVERETPLIWRGPMTDKMVRQFLEDVEWGNLDLLVVDLPPSTGDVPVSLITRTQVDGAVVVVTPQDVAADDALKAIGMFRRMEVPVLGVVENMSYFVCDHCAARHYPFGHGGGQRLAEAAGVPFLGEVPMEPAVREGGDRGEPVALRDDSAAGAAFGRLARAVWRTLSDDAASTDLGDLGH